MDRILGDQNLHTPGDSSPDTHEMKDEEAAQRAISCATTLVILRDFRVQKN